MIDCPVVAAGYGPHVRQDCREAHPFGIVIYSRQTGTWHPMAAPDMDIPTPTREGD